MRVCFFANFGKTAYFHGIGEALKRRGAEIAWISPSSRWTQFLVDRGTPAHAILDLSVATAASHPPPDLDHRVAELELAQDLTLANMILMDRALRLRPPHDARAYLLGVYFECRRFFEERSLELVLGEQTWGWEVMAGAVARQMGVAQFFIGTTRFPSDRIAFWRGYRDQDLILLREVTAADEARAGELVEEFRRRPVKPYYLATNSRRQILRRHWVAEARALLAGAEAGNPAAIGLAGRVRSRGARILNELIARRGAVFEPVPPAPAKPFILLLLHVQPEASVDVCGSYVSDQIDNLTALARSLPATHEIYVKEHPSGLGCRSPADYRRIKSVPGVRLIDPFCDGFSLIRRAWLVASVSGTACYEAGLLGVPAVTFAPMFFRDVLAAPVLDPKSIGPGALTKLVETWRARPPHASAVAAQRLLARVLASSVPGAVGDPVSNPPCMDERNFHALGEAVEKLYDRNRAGGAAAELESVP